MEENKAEEAAIKQCRSEIKDAVTIMSLESDQGFDLLFTNLNKKYYAEVLTASDDDLPKARMQLVTLVDMKLEMEKILKKGVHAKLRIDQIRENNDMESYNG